MYLQKIRPWKTFNSLISIIIEWSKFWEKEAGEQLPSTEIPQVRIWKNIPLVSNFFIFFIKTWSQGINYINFPVVCLSLSVFFLSLTFPSFIGEKGECFNLFVFFTL